MKRGAPKQPVKKVKNERLNRARENLKTIEERIAPYVKPRRYLVYTTHGEWQDTHKMARTD
jgi:hypothetical protein